MSRSSAKKPSPAKSRGSGTPLEGRAWLRIGGARWLREDAEKAGKFIPREYREGYVRPVKAKAAEAVEEAADGVAVAVAEELEAGEETREDLGEETEESVEEAE